MACELRVSIARPVSEMKQGLEQELGEYGIPVEIWPDFAPQTWLDPEPWERATDRAREEIRAYEPYLDERSLTMHPFGSWEDYL